MACIKNIGCYPSCNAIKFPYPALETGVHLVVFDWLGSKKTIAFDAVEGEQFYIPNYFNESSDPVFSIKQPSGSYLCWDKELEALAVCPDNCGKDCDFYRHFTLEINETSDLPGEQPDDPDLAYSDKIYNIDEAHDNGDGTYTINVVGAKNGDLAVDDDGTFYEYQDGIWTVKFQEVCSIQSYPTFSEFPDEPESCVLYIDESTKKQYIESDGAYLEVGSSENIYNTDGTLTEDRALQVGSHDLRILKNNEIDPYHGLIALLSNGTFFFRTSIGGMWYGISTVAGIPPELRIRTGQNLSGLDGSDNYFLKLMNDQGMVEYHPITADDIDDTASLNKFVTQAEKDAIGEGPNSDQVFISTNTIISETDRYKTFAAYLDEDLNITVPDLDVPIGFRFYAVQYGNGTLTINPGEGVELVRDGDSQFVIAKNGVGTIEKVGENSWLLYGDLMDLPVSYNPVTEPVEVLKPIDSGSGRNSLFWLKVFKSSEWPEFTVSTPYFVIFSTDHDTPAGGRISWAEVTDPMLNGYQYKGDIVVGNQAETPWLMRIPSVESGIPDEIFLYYHTYAGDPTNTTGVQETHLITTSGGNEVHLSTWNDRGRPLGVQPGENTTGYLVVNKRGVNDYVGVHTTHGLPNSSFAISTSQDGLNWTRQMPTVEVVVDEGAFIDGYPHFPFYRNNVRYGVSNFVDNDDVGRIVLSLLDDNFRPYKFLRFLNNPPNRRSTMLSVFDDTAYIYVKSGVDNADNAHPYSAFQYDITDTDKFYPVEGSLLYGNEIPVFDTDQEALINSSLLPGYPYAVEGTRVVKRKGAGNDHLEPEYGILIDQSSIDWDISSYQMAAVTLRGNRHLNNPSNLKRGMFTLLVTQDETGGRLLTYGSQYKWPGEVEPTLTTTPNKTDVLHFISDGFNLYGEARLNYTTLNYLHFDGVDDFVGAGTNDVLDLKFPIRIKFRKLTDNPTALMSKINNPFINDNWVISENASGLGLISNVGGSFYEYRSLTPGLVIGEIYDYYLFIDTNGDLVQELDGVEIRRDANPVFASTNSKTFALGRQTGYTFALVDIYSFQMGTEIFPLKEGEGSTIEGSEGTILDINGATWSS